MGILSGKKTYVVGFMSLIGALASVLTGEASIAEGIQVGVTALLGMTLRNGMK